MPKAPNLKVAARTALPSGARTASGSRTALRPPPSGPRTSSRVAQRLTGVEPVMPERPPRLNSAAAALAFRHGRHGFRV